MVMLLIRVGIIALRRLVIAAANCAYGLHFCYFETDPSEMFTQLLHNDRSVMPMTGRRDNDQHVDQWTLQDGHF